MRGARARCGRVCVLSEACSLSPAGPNPQPHWPQICTRATPQHDKKLQTQHSKPSRLQQPTTTPPPPPPPPPPSSINSGILSEVILPKYDVCNYAAVAGLRRLRTIDVTYDGRAVRTAVWAGVVEGLPVTFIEPENGLFWRKT